MSHWCPLQFDPITSGLTGFLECSEDVEKFIHTERNPDIINYNISKVLGKLFFMRVNIFLAFKFNDWWCTKLLITITF
jgi:hypothetical protein